VNHKDTLRYMRARGLHYFGELIPYVLLFGVPIGLLAISLFVFHLLSEHMLSPWGGILSAVYVVAMLFAVCYAVVRLGLFETTLRSPKDGFKKKDVVFLVDGPLVGQKGFIYQKEECRDLYIVAVRISYLDYKICVASASEMLLVSSEDAPQVSEIDSYIS